MKMQNFYCYIGPKASVTGALGGLKTTLTNLDSVPTGNNQQPKTESNLLDGVNKNINLEFNNTNKGRTIA